MPRRFALLLAVLTVTAVTLVTGPPAFADAALKQSSVRDGAVLSEPPGEVTLTFNEKLQERFTTVQVTGAGTEAVEVADATTDGPTVIQRLPARLPPGEYTVAYRIVSADGHPVAGKLTFRLQGPPAITSPSPAIALSVTPSATGASAAAVASAPADDENGSSAWLWIIAGVVVVAVAGVLLAGLRRRGPAGG